jgi:hypothetical protein
MNAQENNKQHAFIKTEKCNLDKLLVDIQKIRFFDIFFLEASSASNSATPQVLDELTGILLNDTMNVFVRL